MPSNDNGIAAGRLRAEDDVANFRDIRPPARSRTASPCGHDLWVDPRTSMPITRGHGAWTTGSNTPLATAAPAE